MEDFLFSMAMNSNSNVAVASGAGPARRQAAGALVPRPRGLVSGLKASLNPRTGKYAAEARAFMREQGLSCYKLMTLGSTRAKEVMEMLHSNYAEAGFTADSRVLRLLDPWTQDLALKGPSTGQKFICKNTDWIRRAMATTGSSSTTSKPPGQ